MNHRYLKRSVMLSAFCLITLTSAIIAAAEDDKRAFAQRNTDDRTTTLSPYSITLQSACGISIPWGSIAGSGDQTVLPGLGYGVILQGRYRIVTDGYITIGTAFSGKNLVTRRSFAGSEITSTVRSTFVDFNAGYRHIWKFLYLDGGFYYGLKAGTWKEETETNGSTTVSRLDGSLERYCHDEIGLYAGSGYTYSWTEHVSLEAGLRFSISFLSSYDAVDSLKSTAILVTGGVTYRI